MRTWADTSLMNNTSRWARLAGLAALSPACGVIGALVDERLNLGYTVWRSACRGAGLSLASVVSFTFQLLPNAIVGALIGALLVQLFVFATRHREGNVEAGLAAHAACAISMPVGLLLCALALPAALMLVAETALTVLVASCLLALARCRSKPLITFHP